MHLPSFTYDARCSMRATENGTKSSFTLMTNVYVVSVNFIFICTTWWYFNIFGFCRWNDIAICRMFRRIEFVNATNSDCDSDWIRLNECFRLCAGMSHANKCMILNGFYYFPKIVEYYPNWWKISRKCTKLSFCLPCGPVSLCLSLSALSLICHDKTQKYTFENCIHNTFEAELNKYMDYFIATSM